VVSHHDSAGARTLTAIRSIPNYSSTVSGCEARLDQGAGAIQSGQQHNPGENAPYSLEDTFRVLGDHCLRPFTADMPKPIFNLIGIGGDKHPELSIPTVKDDGGHIPSDSFEPWRPNAVVHVANYLSVSKTKHCIAYVHRKFLFGVPIAACLGVCTAVIEQTSEGAVE